MQYLNKIIHGAAVEVLGKIPDNTIHLAITSPPYNVGKDYDSHNERRTYWLDKWPLDISRKK